MNDMRRKTGKLASHCAARTSYVSLVTTVNVFAASSNESAYEAQSRPGTGVGNEQSTPVAGLSAAIRADTYSDPT